MKKFRTVASVIIMVIAGIVGFFIGAFLNEPMAGTILFSMIAGIACIVYAIDNHEEYGKFQLMCIHNVKHDWFSDSAVPHNTRHIALHDIVFRTS